MVFIRGGGGCFVDCRFVSFFAVEMQKKEKKSCRNVEFWGLWRCRILSKKMCRNEENLEKNLQICRIVRVLQMQKIEK